KSDIHHTSLRTGSGGHPEWGLGVSSGNLAALAQFADRGFLYQYTALRQRRDFLLRVSQVAGEDAVVMLAEQRGAATDLHGRFREVKRRLGQRHRPDARMRHLLHRAARLDLWVVDGLSDIKHRRAEDAHVLQDGQR